MKRLYLADGAEAAQEARHEDGREVPRRAHLFPALNANATLHSLLEMTWKIRDKGESRGTVPFRGEIW